MKLGRTRTGRFAAGMAGVVAACTVAGVIVLPGAQAQRVSNPGPFTLTPIQGSMNIGSQAFDLSPRAAAQCGDGIDNDGDGLVDAADGGCSIVGAPAGTTVSQDDSEIVDGYQPKVDVAINGSIDAQGNVTVPASGIVFPTAYVALTTNPADVVTAKVTATAPATGSLNPLSGDVSLQVKLRVQMTGSPFYAPLGSNCYIGTPANPITLNLTSAQSGDRYGSRYNTNSGTATLVDGQFAVPGATGCPFQFPFDLNTVINDNMKLPSPAGRNSASINGMTTPLMGRGVIARISTNPGSSNLPAPFDMTFDAGVSEVSKGPAT